MEMASFVMLAAANSAKASMLPALIALSIISGVLILASLLFAYLVLFARRDDSKSGKLRLGMLIAATAVVLVSTVFCSILYNRAEGKPTLKDPSTNGTTITETTTIPTETTEPTIPEPTFEAAYVSSSDPSKWKIKWEIYYKKEIVKSFKRSDPISFGKAEEYTNLEGIITFRGDNYRSGPTYGTANVVEEKISKKWSSNIGALNGWPGSGWTGQPLIVRWDEATKQIMNIKKEKKEKADLVEVIYATLDGYIYFYDLDDGSYTRDPFFVGMNFKGAGSLDPRGYPLMYVGSGDYYGGKAPRMYIIDLINCKVLYEKSGSDSFSLRKDWAAFDSSPLVDAETDTLIWPGESGILYTIKLNTKYDPEAGTISVKPDSFVRNRYSTSRSGSGSYWRGYEPSAVIVGRYLYISENGGMFFCIDLNTMGLVWAQNTKDDSNSTPVFEWDESGETGYIYTAPSLHWTADKNSEGDIYIYKLNAKTGKVVWKKKYDCHTVSGVSGGVQSTPLLGKKGTDLEGMIIYTVARTPSSWEGVMVALNTATGDVIWEKPMSHYTWSSPAAVYTEAGKGYVVVCDSAGKAALVDGATGKELSSVALGTNVEASPAVFEDTIVVGTRGQKIFGLKVK